MGCGLGPTLRRRQHPSRSVPSPDSLADNTIRSVSGIIEPVVSAGFLGDTPDNPNTVDGISEQTAKVSEKP